jgi:hypothetical protein
MERQGEKPVIHYDAETGGAPGAAFRLLSREGAGAAGAEGGQSWPTD